MLFGDRKCKSIPEDLRKNFPWILWFLWKNINNFLFKGKLFLATEYVEKIMENSDKWFYVQSLEEITRTS